MVDDPTLRSFEGHALLGAYKIDDEGVPVEPVDIVVHGKLMNYLVGRQPVKDFPESNGHGRAALGQSAHSRAGVIIIKSSEPLSAEALRAKLLALATLIAMIIAAFGAPPLKLKPAALNAPSISGNLFRTASACPAMFVV